MINASSHCQQPSRISLDDATTRLLAMMETERISYCYHHFLAKSHSSDAAEYRLNIAWREKICQWSYNVVDHFDLSREIVAISLHLFDRYLATRGNLCTGKLALLASLTTLHIAIKLNDPKKMKIETLAGLSRGQFTAKHIEEMEWKVLFALGWRLHPPTEYAFVSHLILFLPNETNPATQKEIFELSRYLTELAVCDSYFVDVDKSIVAFASILNVMEEMSHALLPGGIRERFLRDLGWKVGLHYDLPAVSAARSRLRAMFVATTSDDTTSAPALEVAEYSPTSVSDRKELIDAACSALSKVQEQLEDDAHSVCSSTATSSSACYSFSNSSPASTLQSPLMSSGCHDAITEGAATTQLARMEKRSRTNSKDNTCDNAIPKSHICSYSLSSTASIPPRRLFGLHTASTLTLSRSRNSSSQVVAGEQ